MSALFGPWCVGVVIVAVVFGMIGAAAGRDDPEIGVPCARIALAAPLWPLLLVWGLALVLKHLVRVAVSHVDDEGNAS